MADKKVQAELYRKLNRQMAVSQDEKMELLALMSYLQDSGKDPEVSGAAKQYVDTYFSVTDPDGSLNKKAFEEKIGEMEEYRLKNIYEPTSDIIRNDQGMHSDVWMYDHLNSDYRMGALQLKLQSVVSPMVTMTLSEEIEKAYPEAENSILATEDIAKKKRQALLKEMPLEKRNEIENTLRFWGMESGIKAGKDKEYLKNQTRMEKLETLYDADLKRQNSKESMYQLFARKDMSFLSNEEYSKVRDAMVNSMRADKGHYAWKPADPADRSVLEISMGIDALGKELKDASGLRISDSSKFNAIKDRVEKIQKLVKKGSSKENREELFDSITKLNEECQAYLDKNAGERYTARGNRRKDIVGRLQTLAVDQTQKLLAPETEENMKKEMLGALKAASSEAVGELRDSQYAKDMEKLLVMGGKSEAEAKHQVLDAITVMGGRPGSFSKMENVLNQCRHVIGQMDVRSEALKELGVKDPKHLSEDEMKKILTAPENQDKLNDFYTSLHDMTERLSMEGTHPSLQAVYRSMQLDGTLAKDTAYERTNAAILKGLSGEKAWQNARNAYKSGDRSMDIAEMAALKSSIRVQRELIIENGTLSEQNRLQSEAMEHLAKDTEALLKRVPDTSKKTDFRGVVKDMTLERVMEGNGRLPAVEEVVANAMGKNCSEVTRRHLEELGPARNMKDLEPSTHMTQMERSNTINHLLVAYMSSQGYNFTTALDDPEARREAAKDFRAFLETHPCEVDKDGIPKTEKDRENIEKLAKFYKRGQQMVSQIRIPEIDFSDPIQRAAHKYELMHIPGMMIDLSQNMEGPSKIEGFADVYGGKEKFKNIGEEQTKIQTMIDFFVLADDPENNIDCGRGCISAQLYGNAPSGKMVSKLMEEMEGISLQEVGTLGAMTMVQYQNQLGNLASGKKKITMDEAIQSCVKAGASKEMFDPLKAKIAELQSAKSKEIPKQKAEEKNQSQPSVKRMSFNELIKSERKPESARRSVRSSSMVEKHSEEKERRSMRDLGKK